MQVCIRQSALEGLRLCTKFLEIQLRVKISSSEEAEVKRFSFPFKAPRLQAYLLVPSTPRVALSSLVSESSRYTQNYAKPYARPFLLKLMPQLTVTITCQTQMSNASVVLF